MKTASPGEEAENIDFEVLRVEQSEVPGAFLGPRAIIQSEILEARNRRKVRHGPIHEPVPLVRNAHGTDANTWPLTQTVVRSKEHGQGAREQRYLARRADELLMTLSNRNG